MISSLFAGALLFLATAPGPAAAHFWIHGSGEGEYQPCVIYNGTRPDPFLVNSTIPLEAVTDCKSWLERCHITSDEPGGHQLGNCGIWFERYAYGIGLPLFVVLLALLTCFENFCCVICCGEKTPNADKTARNLRAITLATCAFVIVFYYLSINQQMHAPKWHLEWWEWIIGPLCALVFVGVLFIACFEKKEDRKKKAKSSKGPKMVFYDLLACRGPEHVGNYCQC